MAARSGSGRKHDVATLNPFFELWLEAHQPRVYDEALAEPVPEELLRLVAQSRNDNRP